MDPLSDAQRRAVLSELLYRTDDVKGPQPGPKPLPYPTDASSEVVFADADAGHHRSSPSASPGKYEVGWRTSL